MESHRENYNLLIKSNKLKLKSLGRFQSEKENVFTGEGNKIVLGINNDKRI